MNEMTEAVLKTLNQFGASTEDVISALRSAEACIQEYEALGQNIHSRNKYLLIMGMSYA
jgi:hypothetical protein